MIPTITKYDTQDQLDYAYKTAKSNLINDCAEYFYHRGEMSEWVKLRFIRHGLHMAITYSFLIAWNRLLNETLNTPPIKG